MIILRPIKRDDLATYTDFAFSSSIGITNLPKNQDLLKAKLDASLAAFSHSDYSKEQETFTFVLEDLNTQTIVGTSSIFSKTTNDYYYKMETLHTQSTSLPIPKEISILRPIYYAEGPTETCALYLNPDYRKEGLGLLLSFGRFLFIASHRHRFTDTILSELRGYSDENLHSPFWEGLGRHFLDMDYHEVTTLIEKDKSFISKIVPEYPIYTSFLPQDTLEHLGETHPNTVPAYKMLAEEGFQFSQEIDIVDGGPKLIAQTDQIRTIAQSEVATIKEITSQTTSEEQFLICNPSLNFRACMGSLTIHDDSTISLPKEIAEALHLAPNDPVRFVRSS